MYFWSSFNFSYSIKPDVYPHRIFILICYSVCIYLYVCFVLHTNNGKIPTCTCRTIPNVPVHIDNSNVEKLTKRWTQLHVHVNTLLRRIAVFGHFDLQTVFAYWTWHIWQMRMPWCTYKHIHKDQTDCTYVLPWANCIEKVLIFSDSLLSKSRQFMTRPREWSLTV